ncbi:MAG: hypothetical protein PHR30_14590, partial [Gallionellaceae bacterium]|nr:hypothetical protein [Gallionellaceae bacterium]
MNTTTLTLALTATLGIAGLAHASGNPFAMQSLSSGYMVAVDAKTMEGKCGTGKAEEAKCGAGKTKDDKCGASKAKAPEPKCGANKAPEAKCGAG